MTKKKICIVEDEYLIAHALKSSALGDYFEISHADNGKDGLELIRNEKPELVLMDLMMPDMDGFSAIKAIRSDDSIKGTKIIVLSNDETKESREQAKKLGVFDYVTKGESDLTELAKKIELAVS